MRKKNKRHYTVCPRSSYQFYIVSHHIKSSWTCSKLKNVKLIKVETRQCIAQAGPQLLLAVP